MEVPVEQAEVVMAVGEDEECEEPLPPPQPYQSSSKLDEFLKIVRSKISSPKKTLKKTVSSKVFQHFTSEVNDRYKSLNNAILKIGAKQISLIKYYRDLPPVAEDIALCFLLLFEVPVPKTHYWEKFAVFIAQPGVIIQKFRVLPMVLENNYLSPQLLSKIHEIFSRIPKNDLKVKGYFYELQLLIWILKEFLDLVEPIPEEPKVFMPPHIPKTRRNTEAQSVDVSSIPVHEILNSTDHQLLRTAVSQEKKLLVNLKSEATKMQWEENRFLKSEHLKESKREDEREIEIQKNTVSDI